MEHCFKVKYVGDICLINANKVDNIFHNSLTKLCALVIKKQLLLVISEFDPVSPRVLEQAAF